MLPLRQMHDDVVPELASGPVLEVQTEALGLSSQEVEQYVTVPLENNLLDGVMGVWDVRSQLDPRACRPSTCTSSRASTLLHARQLVEERLTNAFSLPNVSKPPLLIQPLSSSEPRDDDRSQLAEPSIRSSSPTWPAGWSSRGWPGVPGVANVAIFGQRDRQIQVLVDPARLARSRRHAAARSSRRRATPSSSRR